MEKDKVYISGAIAHYNIDERKGCVCQCGTEFEKYGLFPGQSF